jgi:hypothetical protein
MAVDDSGNQRIAFEWGNFPLQPNNDRDDIYIGRPGENNIITQQDIPPELGSGDSHVINATSWNQYPEFAKSHNYMVTDAEYKGGNVYEYTSENELHVGDSVIVSNAGEFSFSYPQPVIYADKLKFRVENELGTGPKLTGLRARVDKNEPYAVGHTRYVDEGEKSFLWPSYGFCYNTFNSGDGKWQDMIEYLRAAGVDSERLVEATFTGGENKYDYEEGTYDGGVIFWDYIPANEIVNVDWETGQVILGKDLDGYVIGSSHAWGSEISVDPNSDLDLSFVAFTNDPAKDTANWWY